MLNTLTRSNKIKLLQPANYFGTTSANNITNSNLQEAEKTYIEHKSGMFNIRMNKENNNFETAKERIIALNERIDKLKKLLKEFE